MFLGANGAFLWGKIGDVLENAAEKKNETVKERNLPKCSTLPDRDFLRLKHEEGKKKKKKASPQMPREGEGKGGGKLTYGDIAGTIDKKGKNPATARKL